MEKPHWQSFMEQAVRLLYFLAESPDQLCSLLLQRSTQLLLDQFTKTADAASKETVQTQGDSQDSQEPTEQGIQICVVKSSCYDKFRDVHVQTVVSEHYKKQQLCYSNADHKAWKSFALSIDLGYVVDRFQLVSMHNTNPVALKYGGCVEKFPLLLLCWRLLSAGAAWV